MAGREVRPAAAAGANRKRKRNRYHPRAAFTASDTLFPLLRDGERSMTQFDEKLTQIHSESLAGQRPGVLARVGGVVLGVVFRLSLRPKRRR